MRLQLRTGQTAAFDGPRNGLHRRLGVRHEEQHIVARLDGLNLNLSRC